MIATQGNQSEHHAGWYNHNLLICCISLLGILDASVRISFITYLKILTIHITVVLMSHAQMFVHLLDETLFMRRNCFRTTYIIKRRVVVANIRAINDNTNAAMIEESFSDTSAECSISQYILNPTTTMQK